MAKTMLCLLVMRPAVAKARLCQVMTTLSVTKAGLCLVEMMLNVKTERLLVKETDPLTTVVTDFRKKCR